MPAGNGTTRHVPEGLTMLFDTVDPFDTYALDDAACAAAIAEAHRLAWS